MHPLLDDIYLFVTSIFIMIALQAPSPDTEVNLHFIAFVHKDGSLYELGMLIDNIV